RYWIHNAMLQLGGEKMSKSIGNLVTISEILERGLADAFRFYVLQTHYRHPLTYTEAGLESAARGLERLQNAMREFERNNAQASETVASQIHAAWDQFTAAMDDDFNTPIAVSVLFDLARLANQ